MEKYLEKGREKMGNQKIRGMVLISLFAALSAVGAAIKIPAVIATVALDSFPALLAAALLGPVAGAAVGGFGHMLSALMGGMPLGPLHGLIAVEMAVLAALFSILYRSERKWSAALFFILANSFVAPLPFMFIISKAFYITLIPSLVIGSVLNTAFAMIVIPRLSRILSGRKGAANERRADNSI